MQPFENFGSGRRATVAFSATIDRLTDVLKHQDLKVLVLETDMLYYGYHAPSGKTPFYEKYTAAGEPFFSTVSESRFDDIISTRASVFNFNDRWKRFDAATFAQSFTADEPYNCNHGFYFITKKDTKVQPNKNMTPTDEVAVIPYESHYYLEKIIRLCQDKGIEVVLFEFPQARDYSYAKHNALQQAADADGVEFIDMNLMIDELGIDYAQDFRDAAHVNYYGAKKVSAYVADYLHTHYGDVLTDRRGDPHYRKYEDAQQAFITENFFGKYHRLHSYSQKKGVRGATVEEDEKALDLG